MRVPVSIQPIEDLGLQRLGIIGLGQLGLVRHLEAAFERKRSPVARGPGHPHRVRPGLAVRCTSDAEGLAQDHRTVGNASLAQGDQRDGACPHGGFLFRRLADDEPGAVLEVNHRQVEQRGQIDQPGQLLARVGRPTAAVDLRVLGVDGDGHAVEASKAADDRGAPASPDLEERIVVDDGVEDGPHVIGLASVAGNGVDQPVLSAAR